jgi:DNA-binding transcriptional regulator YiaG
MTGPELLRNHLAQRKLSQAEFAALAGVSTASVSLWLSGHSKPGRESALLVQTATDGVVTFASWTAKPPRRKTSRRTAA